MTLYYYIYDTVNDSCHLMQHDTKSKQYHHRSYGSSGSGPANPFRFRSVIMKPISKEQYMFYESVLKPMESAMAVVG